jgi:tetratricopeptide (TPR) repeat protein
MQPSVQSMARCNGPSQPQTVLTDGYNIRGQYDQVLEICRRLVALHPNKGEDHHRLYEAYLHNGRYREALPELQQTVIRFGHPELAGPLARAYDKGGIKAMLRLWARDLENLQSVGVPPVFVARVYAQLDDAENAFKWLEKGYVERDGFLVDLNVHPDWKPLRPDPRFGDLVRRVGLTQ